MIIFKCLWLIRSVQAMKRAMLKWQKSGFNTVKIHAMSHFNDCIRRSGLPWEYSTNMYEQMHTTLMKAGYRSSNKRQATPQIARHNQRLVALRKMQDTMEGLDNSREKEKYTSLDQVSFQSYGLLYYCSESHFWSCL